MMNDGRHPQNIPHFCGIAYPLTRRIWKSKFTFMFFGDFNHQSKLSEFLRATSVFDTLL
jgi:hypothetical protein